MLIEEALYSLLKQSDDVTNLVAGRIYPVTMPELEKGKAFYPAVVFQLMDRDREQTHDGPTPLVKSFIGISCLAETYFSVKTLAEKVRLAVNGKETALAAIYGKPADVRGIFLDSEKDEYVFDEVEQLALFHVPMDFRILHLEPL